MDKRIVGGRLLAVAGLVTAALLAFYGGTALRAVLSPGAAMAYAQDTEPAAQPVYTGPLAVAEAVWVGDEEQGRVLLGDSQPLEIQTTAGGLSGYERAIIVAKRLNDRLAEGLTGAQVAAGRVGSAWVVVGGGRSLITANQAEADRYGLSVADLAQIWVTNIAAAVDMAWEAAASPEAEVFAEAEAEFEEPEEIVEESEEVIEETEEADWQPAEPYANKIVPLVSVLEGLRVGIARINGPQSAVAQVQVVAQLETDYQRTLEIDIYVPISTKVPGQSLARVQGVGVTGIGDLRIR